MGWRAYKTFQPAVSPVAGHYYLFGGMYGQVGWSLGIIRGPIYLSVLVLRRRAIYTNPYLLVSQGNII
jgi:hypothetical protein